MNLIARYCRDMARRGLAANTIDKRARCLALFEAEVGWVAEKETLEAWLDGRGLVPKSRAVWLSHLHCFYAWANAEGVLETDPTQKIQPPRLPRRLPRPIPDQALQKALRIANRVQRAWLLLGAYEGFRCQEIAGLSVEDIDVVGGLLRVVEGKGNRERMLPLHPEVRRALEALPLPVDGAVFRKPDGTRMTPGAVAHAMGRYLHDIGVSSTPHSLRHWFGTNVYRSTTDIRLTQELMGHASPSTTAIYAAFDPRRGAAAVRGLNAVRP